MVVLFGAWFTTYSEQAQHLRSCPSGAGYSESQALGLPIGCGLVVLALELGLSALSIALRPPLLALVPAFPLCATGAADMGCIGTRLS